MHVVQIPAYSVVAIFGLISPSGGVPQQISRELDAELMAEGS